MIGFPLRQLAVTAALFLGLLIPLAALSRRQPPAPVLAIDHVHDVERTQITAWATLHFAHPPLHVHLHQGDREIWHLDPTDEKEFESEIVLGVGNGFAEIVAHVVWPAGTPESVIELTLEPDGMEARTISDWGHGKLDTVLMFEW